MRAPPRYLAFLTAVLALPGGALAQDYCGLNDYSSAFCVSASPVSPVGGNPLSLESRMIAGDFRLGSLIGPSPDFFSAGAGGASLPPLIGIGLSLKSVSSDDFSIEQVELPFSYSRPLADPRYAWVFELPIAYTDITTIGFGTARIYSASLAAGIRLPLLDNWIITPTARIGISSDTGEAIDGYLFGASVVSNYATKLGDLDVSIGNQISGIKSIGATGAEFDIGNIVLRNGVGLSGPTAMQLFGLPVTWEGSVVNTQYFGGAVFTQNSTDVAMSFGTQNSANGVTWDSMRMGLTYTFSNTDLDGLAVNFGYRF